MNTEDIRDIRLPIETPVWIWGLLGFCAVVLIVIGIIIFRRRNAKPVISRPAWELALEELKQLELRDYPRQSKYQPFYVELSAIIRRYLERRFGINAPEMTTEEFLNHPKTMQMLAGNQQQFLAAFLNGCDMVKFAKHQPGREDAVANFERAKKLIEETRPADGI